MARTFMEQMQLKSHVDVVRAMNPGISVRAACAQAGVNHASYLRWVKVVETGGPRAQGKRGRPAKWPALTDDERRCLKWFAAWTESFAMAAEYFVEYARTGASPLPRNPWPAPAFGSAAASPHLAEMIHHEMQRGGRWDTRLPLPLRNAARLTDAERRMIRGEKQYNDAALSTRRLMVIRDFNPDTGEIEDITMWAGAGYCSDDVSPEQPSQSESANGPRLNRQTLATCDVYSRKWLGLLAVNRDGDAYTKVDQADHIASIIAQCGLPYYWAFERGPWQNDFIDGVRLESGWGEAAAESTLRWGGLCDLFHVRHKFKPQHKVIEGAFSYLQARMRGRALGVGSVKRGELERATKVVSAAMRGNEDALRLIWNGADKADELWRQMEAMNDREQRREFLDGAAAKPNDLWAGTHKSRALPAAEAWRLLPIKECRVVIKQRISITLKGYTRFDFRCVDGRSLPLLDNGHRLLVAFHPDTPEAGAHIFNGDMRQDYNRDGFKFGQFIGLAPFLPPAVMEDFTGTGDFTASRQARGAVSASLRVFKGNHGGVVRVDRAADGLGKSLHRSNDPDSTGRAAAVPVPPPARRVASLTDLLPRETFADEPRFSPPASVRRQPVPGHASRIPADDAAGGELVTTGADPWADIS
jgi:hypothetical protein